MPGRIVAAWRQGGLEVVLSHYILGELTRVLPRLPRVRMTPEEIRDLADSLMFEADVVEPQGAHDAYQADEYVTEGGAVWRCKVGGTVYPPSVLPGSWDVYQ